MLCVFDQMICIDCCFEVKKMEKDKINSKNS